MLAWSTGTGHRPGAHRDRRGQRHRRRATSCAWSCSRGDAGPAQPGRRQARPAERLPGAARAERPGDRGHQQRHALVDHVGRRPIFFGTVGPGPIRTYAIMRPRQAAARHRSAAPAHEPPRPARQHRAAHRPAGGAAGRHGRHRHRRGARLAAAIPPAHRAGRRGAGRRAQHRPAGRPARQRGRGDVLDQFRRARPGFTAAGATGTAPGAASSMRRPRSTRQRRWISRPSASPPGPSSSTTFAPGARRPRPDRRRARPRRAAPISAWSLRWCSTSPAPWTPTAPRRATAPPPNCGFTPVPRSAGTSRDEPEQQHRPAAAGGGGPGEHPLRHAGDGAQPLGLGGSLSPPRSTSGRDRQAWLTAAAAANLLGDFAPTTLARLRRGAGRATPAPRRDGDATRLHPAGGALPPLPLPLDPRPVHAARRRGSPGDNDWARKLWNATTHRRPEAITEDYQSLARQLQVGPECRLPADRRSCR